MHIYFCYLHALARPETFTNINSVFLARVLRDVTQIWQGYPIAADKPPRVLIEQLKQTDCAAHVTGVSATKLPRNPIFPQARLSCK
ncbi:hypothetical protein FIBSPDRAFT_875636 [Athelia psychrophila]|uniref:Uncharacterized protein n=1 Tax=Athelia psychrophila TaxID=1759441 RepID=A0A167XM52_9AGAM|nr:hypothetical protein FIBSPDRAFT_875636 [Fibularhizoctonia sp. CBS 109695]